MEISYFYLLNCGMFALHVLAALKSSLRHEFSTLAAIITRVKFFLVLIVLNNSMRIDSTY